jgi:cell division protein ZapA (FtsZ GTPase activity inhibitor)
MSQAIKVHIFGQSYSIQGDLDEAYVQKLAVHVDEKMHGIAQMTPTMDTQKIAMLIGDRQVQRPRP